MLSGRGEIMTKKFSEYTDMTLCLATLYCGGVIFVLVSIAVIIAGVANALMGNSAAAKDLIIYMIAPMIGGMVSILLASAIAERESGEF